MSCTTSFTADKLLPLWLKKKIAYVTIFALVSQPLIVGAEAVADSQAAEQNRPKVETTQNGTPIVQITAPSAAGVSRNIYSQFNVDPQGLILNNSQTLTQTQLAGYITGNPNLANGTAKIILNEVSGHDPSTLRGYTEVAGSRAEVVIANPNGITGNGFGFINASRAVLTTGTPVFGGNDSLEAFRVNQGQITVEGNGMDAQQTDRADLISRAVQINAGIWGKEVNVVAGANQVEHDSLQATVLPADNNRPQVAIDVSALGGMYANKIRLVGTEEGLGVNSQGTLSSLNGNMELTNDGKVALAGSIHAAKSITIHASQDITNQGTIYAKDDIHVNSASGTLVNTGMIAAAQNTDISAQLISSSGIVGSGINTDGSIGNSGNLSINTTNGIVAQGKNLAGGNLALTGKSIELSGAATYAGGNASITATNGDVNNTGGMIQINHALTIQSNGSVQNDKGVNGQAGQIIADKLTIETGQLLNQSGIIQQTGIDNTNVIVTSNIDNSDGTIITNGYNLSLQAGVITNNQGQIQHAGNGTLLIQNTGELKNINGNIASNGQITSQTQNVVNTQGTIEAKRQISVSASSLTNNQGTITSENAVCITTPGTINNQQGSILSNKDLKITAQSLSNLGGNIINHDTSDMNITVSQDIQNQSGIIGGNGNIGISYQNLINRGGKVQAQDNLNISSAETTDNTNGSISAEKDVIFRQNSANLTNANGNINAGGNLDVQATIVDNLNGSIAANKDLTLQAQSLNGNGLAIAGQDLAITLNGNFTNSSVGQLRANRNLKLLTSGTVLNQGIMTAVGNTTIDGNKVTNDNAATMAAGEDFNLIASEDVNNNGQLDGNLVTIRGQNVSNTGSMTANNLTITSNNLTNTGASAVIASTTDINLNIENSLINKDAATIYSMGNTTVAGSAGRDETEKPIDRAVSVLNQSAIIQADKDMQIYANEITNKKREFVTGQTVVSQASNGNPGQLINTSYVNKSFFPWELSGMVPFDAIIVPVTVPVGTYLKGQVIRETSILKDSPEGKILAGRNMTLDAGNINNNLSWILAAGALNASVDASINNVTIGRTRDITKLYHEYTDYWAGVEYYYWTTEKVYAGIDPTNYEPIYDERRVFNSGHAMGHVYNDRDLPSSTTTEALSDQYTSLYGGGQSLNLQAHAINNIVNSPVGVPGSDNATLPASQSPNLAGAHANHISITLPTNGLYTIHPEPESHYLIETNPRFANFSNFISSDYMLKQLHIDFDKSLKQIGDGFYEQQLIRDRLVQLTGRQVINGYSSSQEQYKALLDNGVTYAKQFNLQVGVTLTAAQMAQLTSDMVWLVEQEVQGQKVLVPIVYLAQTRVGDLKASGALMSADEVVLKSNGDLTNIGIIKANDQIDVSASNIINHGGSFEGKQITLQADKNIAISGGQVSATGDIIVNAGQNLKFDSLQTSQRIAIPFSVMETTTNLTSSIKAGGDINLVAGQDANLAGAQVGAGQDLTLTSIAGNINISAVKDEKMIDTKTGTSRNWKRTRTDDETIVGSTLQAGGNINIVAVNPESTKTNGGSITIAGSNVYSDSGKISINADKDVTVQEATEKHESLVEKHQVKSGFLSKKTTDTRDYSLINQAVGSTISGDTVDIHANNDITVQGSNVVGSNAVDLIAENDINLTSAAETGASEHYKVTKKSGLFSGGGLGVTIGKQSEKLDVNEKTLDQVGSTIGSVNESVSINAGKQVTSDGTTLVAQKDITITGNNVSINNSVDTYDSQTQYEFKQSGISVSLGGGVVNTLTDTASHVERSSQVSDDRLKALYDYKAAKDIKKLGDQLQGGLNKNNLKKDVTVNISIGSSKTTSEQNVHTETANSSNITAGNNVNITAKADDVTLQDTKINAKNVKIDAERDINLTSAQNVEQTDSKSDSSSWSLGVSLNGGVFGNASKGNSNGNGTVVTHSGTEINATDTVDLHSDRDTNILDSQVKGKEVIADVGRDLNMASQQDIDNYAEKSSSSGIGFSTGPSGGVTGSVSKGKINSEYSSVTEQAGIYAGEGGFDITVGKNTDLKGAVISSEATPDKNRLSTDTLTYSDIENHADYSASSVGVSVNTSKDAKNNEYGITPNIGVPVSGDASSTTKSAISPGTIEVRSNPNQDISNLSRDTTNAVNTLDKIFDKKSVQEKQELSKLFGELAYEEVHKISDRAKDAAQRELDKAKEDKNSTPEQLAALQAKVDSWDVGGANKIALHALVGGIMSELGGSDFMSGAAGAGFNQAIQKELKDHFENQPDMWQWASALVGATAAKVVGGDEQTGASTATSATKNNDNGWSTYRDTQRMRKLENTTGETIRNLIDAGIIGDPRTMQCDYAYFELSIGLGKFASGAGGFMVDKQGTVYVIVDASAGVGVAPPLTGTVGMGYVGNISDADRADLSNALAGLSAGITSVAGIGGNISAGIPSVALTGEIQASLGIGKSAGVRYAIPIFNIPK